MQNTKVKCKLHPHRFTKINLTLGKDVYIKTIIARIACARQHYN